MKEANQKTPNKALTKSKNNFPVVGVGASAGGLSAFKEFIQSIPEDSGMAYVLVQHLDPDHDSLLPELLQKVTEIPVLEISDEIEVEPNKIYIIPSNKMLLSNDGKLELSPRPDKSEKLQNLPIDLFFTSLAWVHQAHSIGVVLTGTGSDGTEGLKAIKEHGGITFTQDLESAEYDGMPKSAADAGVVDFALPLDKIPAKILETIKKIEAKDADGDGEEYDGEDEKVFKKILSLLRTRKGTDFTYYKQTTIRRRILRRMALNNKEEPIKYLDQLKSNSSEQDVLYQDLLIPVTTFFRDPEVFENLCNTTFPNIIKNKKEGVPIRIWVAACSTGQEAYTIAICLLEFFENNPSLGAREKIQIFGTDISQPAIEKSRTGFYIKNEVQDLSSERLKKYFSKKDGHYQINKNVREICVFALHDFLRDPPFGKMDFISCRNVLIYMEPYLQKKALTTFHYALNPNGYLLLGKSETVSNVPDLFAPSQEKHKIYSRKDKRGRYILVTSQRSEQNIRDINIDSPEETLRTDFQEIADDVILSNYSPAGVVVNETMDIVHFRGNTSRFLEQSPGKPSHNLLKMAKSGLAFELRTILHKAKKNLQDNQEGKSSVVKKDILIEVNKQPHNISIEALPLPKLVEPHYLVLFHDHGLAESNEETSAAPKDKEKEKRIKQLEQELSQIRENMRSITEEQEAANEELQSANEELESNSEELQSLNEELETSKEELQSTNEELTVLNQELQSLNSQLISARDYAEVVVDTIWEPLLILDKNLHVISANKAFYRTFKVREDQTEGKLVYDIGNRQWDIPELRTLLGNILPEKESFTNFEMTHDFPTIGTKTMLLNARQIFSPNNEDNRILLSVEDITKVKKAGAKNARLSAIVESSEDAIISKNLDGTITSWNKGAEKIFGYNPREIIGKHISILIPPEQQQEEGIRFDTVKEGGKVNGFESIRITKEGKKVPISLTGSPIKSAEGKIIGISEISRDITERKKAVQKIEESERLYHELIHSSPSHIASYTGEDHIISIANDAILEAWGKGREVIGKSVFETVPELRDQGFKEILDTVYKTGKAYNAFEQPVDLCRNGKIERSYYNLLYYPQRDSSNNITGIVDISTEVTPQAELNIKLKESESHFRKMADLMPGKILNTDTKGNAYYFNRHWLSDTGQSEEDLEGRGWQNCIHPDDFGTFIRAWKDSLKSGKEFEMEFRCVKQNGEYEWHLGRAVPLLNKSGKIKFWINSAIEIQKIKDEEKRKEDFLKMVSHELKTPITSIKGYVQLLLGILKKDKDVPLSSLPLKPSLERIDAQIGRLSRLISEMLDLSRLEDNRLVFQNETFSINKFVDETVEDIKHSNTGQDIKVEHKFECNIKADKDRIGQVLINLITNSIKYSTYDQPVEVKVEKGKNNFVKVSVKDHGIGIAENDLQKIFDRFYRVTGEKEDTYAGFGIGLFLSKEIIQRHNGTLSVKSKIGEGSIFSFSLPYEV